MDNTQEIIAQIIDEEDVSFPFPQCDVHLNQEK